MNIKEKILSKIPNDLTELEKARLIYIELGKLLSFSTKFNNTDDYSTRKMFMEDVDIDTFNKNQVNCIMWSSLYSQLLNTVNIKNRIISSGHQFVEFYINDKRWCADATYDLYSDLARIHNNDETIHFGPSLIEKKNIVHISPEIYKQLELIDKKIGYSNSKKEDISELKDMLLKIKNKNISLEHLSVNSSNELDATIIKLEYLFEKIGILADGFYEAKDFVRMLTEIVLTPEEMHRVKGIELKRTNSNKEVDIVQCIYAKGENKIHYYLLSPNLPIRKSSEYEIIKLSILGYGIDENEKIPGVEFPTKFIPGKISTNIVYKLQKNKIKDLMIYNQNQHKTL